MSKDFKEWIKEYPMQFYGPIIVLICSVLRLFVIENELMRDILPMIMWSAIGFQWLSIYKSSVAIIKTRRKADMRHLEDIPGSFLSSLHYLVPYEGSFINRLWNKLSRKTSLLLYKYSEIEIESFTKFRVTKKELFSLKLNGFINTDNAETAKKGIEYIEGQS